MAEPNPSWGALPPLPSLYANDPAMKEVVEEFIGDIPERVRSIRTAFESGNRVDLTRLAHQLRGAGAGYGYPALTSAAGALEDQLRALSSDGALSAVAQEVDELIMLCERASRGGRSGSN